MSKPIKRFYEGILLSGSYNPVAALTFTPEGMKSAITSPVKECSFNPDGTLSRVVTENTIYVQVKE